ncbi:hypothetical protein AB7M16_001750 [Bradyrhizobium sp. USDA 372]|nr:MULTISPECIES: hypothetical protein [Bradyrhizobium]MDD1518509.1 hypothetical protein [Bradyrhizobium sp. WBAH30]MDD1542307.1 hypothetical protein [Bradyrhizobium sp. WBAH41]MDD1556459.1 hypothetical protein [Bradyrhizobium sp. WBAH23]MDD1561700.1 hypothetical protein [Bradyrhizobium sp. WBAH33]MDD1589278.1 hypothetical protein [Bradyrhizobium sp. WBAH42]
MSEEIECELERVPVRLPTRGKTSRARTLTEIRSLARSHTRTAIRVLVGIMRSEDASPAARVSAANAILDRGWGKVAQPVESGEDGMLELIHRIERIIVHPPSSSGGDAVTTLEMTEIPICNRASIAR